MIKTMSKVLKTINGGFYSGLEVLSNSNEIM